MTVENVDAHARGHRPASAIASAAHFSHLVQHLYIGAGPLILPLIMNDLALSYTLIGLAISARTLFAGFLQVFYDTLSRWYSKKRIINSSNALSSLSSIGMSLSSSFTPFLFFNSLWGLATSPVHPLAGALRAGPSRVGRPGINIGLFYSYAYIGNLIGATIAVLSLTHIGWRGVFVVMGLITFLALIHGFFLPAEPREQMLTRQPASITMKAALRSRSVVATCIVGFLFFGGTNVFIRHLLPLYLTNDLHVPVDEAGLIFIFISVIGIVSPIFFGWVSNGINRRTVLLVLAIALSLGFSYLAEFSELTVAAIWTLCLLSFLAWSLLALLQEFLLEILQAELKGVGGNLLLTVNICSFVLWAPAFGLLTDLDGSFRQTFYLISGLCLVSIPLLLATRSRAAM